MTIERLRDAVTARPFQAFTIVMADGTRHAVKHPEMIAVNPKAERTFALQLDNERIAIIDLFLVSTLEVDSRQPSNGRHRKTG